MTYSTPDSINSFLATVNVGDVFIAMYPNTSKIRVVTKISSGIHGVDPDSDNSFSMPYNSLSQYETQAHTLISVNSIDEAYSLYPELFI